MADLLDQLHEIRRELMPGPKGPCQNCGKAALRAERCLSCRKKDLLAEIDGCEWEADQMVARFIQTTISNLDAIRDLVARRRDR